MPIIQYKQMNATIVFPMTYFQAWLNWGQLAAAEGGQRMSPASSLRSFSGRRSRLAQRPWVAPRSEGEAKTFTLLR